MTVPGREGGPVPIVALDFGTLDEAMALVDELGDLCRFYKVGSELFTAAGPGAVAALRAAGCDVMLDLKFHDIPNTVSGAVGSAAEVGARIVTIHASGGSAMIRAAVESAGEGCELFAVTLLTSLDAPSASAIWGRDSIKVGAEVVRLATMARDAGAGGVVASGSEVEAIKAALGSGFEVLVPGVRLAASDPGDQRRPVTPADARRLRADYVVVGRAVTAAPNRRDAMKTVSRELGATRRAERRP
jgi:orotidine-5'-phosphate decarboxylase